MNRIFSWRNVLLVGVVLVSNCALAVTPDEEERDKVCKKPKFRDFNPTQLAEVPPESEISFHASRGTDPHSVTAESKAEKLKVSVEDKKTFLLVKAKLPASLTEGFARIHVTAKAQDGGCLGQDGWLIKLKPAEGGAKLDTASSKSSQH